MSFHPIFCSNQPQALSIHLLTLKAITEPYSQKQARADMPYVQPVQLHRGPSCMAAHYIRSHIGCYTHCQSCLTITSLIVQIVGYFVVVYSDNPTVIKLAAGNGKGPMLLVSIPW